MAGGSSWISSLSTYDIGCFLSDTPILRPDGTSTLISSLRPGEKVLAFTADGRIAEATIREVLADGAIWGHPVMWEGFVNWNVMKLPAGAFLTLGILLGLSNHFLKKK